MNVETDTDEMAETERTQAVENAGIEDPADREDGENDLVTVVE